MNQKSNTPRKTSRRTLRKSQGPPTEADSITNDVIKKRTVRRPEHEIEQDIIRYNELLKYDERLEMDIPPRKQKDKLVFKVKIENDSSILQSPLEKISESSANYQRQSRSQPVPRLQYDDNISKTGRRRRNHRLVPELPDISKIIKPKYKFKGSKQRSSMESPMNYAHKLGPPCITDESRISSFEAKVLIENSYSELIKLIKSKIEVKDESERFNHIDFGMKWNLLEKNLTYEKQKFDILDEEERMKLHNLKGMFNEKQNWNSSYDVYESGNRGSFSEDIDSFFRQLCYQPDRVVPETTVEGAKRLEYLKKNVPLA